MVVKFAPTEVKMSSDGVLVTPVELNRNLLNSFFKFKPHSKLELFIMKKNSKALNIPRFGIDGRCIQNDGR